MTTVFVIAAVLLGAEGGKPAPDLKLKQPETVVEQALPVAKDFEASSVSLKKRSQEGGLIKPVEYRPSEQSGLAPVVRASSFTSIRQPSTPSDASPSDIVVPPPVPSMPSHNPSDAKPLLGDDMPQSTVLSESYSIHDDYQVTSGSCCEDASICQAAHGCNLCGGCNTWGHGHGGFYARHCLPSPWHAPGNMVPHIPYEALPKTYYYFRPYQMFMIPDQQAQAASWVENPALPYSNNVFEKVYAELEPELNPQGEVVVPVVPVAPAVP